MSALAAECGDYCYCSAYSPRRKNPQMIMKYSRTVIGECDSYCLVMS